MFAMSWSLPPAQPRAETTCALHGYPESGSIIKLACPNSPMNNITGVLFAVWGNAPANASGAVMGNSEDCCESPAQSAVACHCLGLP